MTEHGIRSEEKCKTWNGSSWEEINISLAEECLLSITFNGRLLPSIVCSPAKPEELIKGILLTGRHIQHISQIKTISVSDSETSGKLTAEVITVPTSKSSEKKRPAVWDADMIKALCECAMNSHSRAGHSTHSCTLMRSGKIICVREDISRHSAIARVAGWAADNETPLGECAVFLSGRISKEAVKMTEAAGISVLCGKGLPTAQAADLAGRLGLTLIHYSKKRGLLLF